MKEKKMVNDVGEVYGRKNRNQGTKRKGEKGSIPVLHRSKKEGDARAKDSMEME